MGLFRGSGTSEATAITTGVAAAYLADHPGSTPLEVKSALRTGAQPLCTWGSGAGAVSMSLVHVAPRLRSLGSWPVLGSDR